MKKTVLREYAKLIAKAGANVQKGQEVFITAELDQPEFVAMVVEECYRAGAKRVVMEWTCDEIDFEREVRVQRVNRLKLDGLLWQHELTPTNKSDAFISDVPASQYGTMQGYSLCQYAVFDGVAYDIEMKESCRCYVWVKSVTLQFKVGSGVNSVDAFSEWLKSRPDASISYCLATPIETPLNPAELTAYKALTTYAPNTVAQASDGVGIKL